MEIYVECPHCREIILIIEKEINCAIFRHGSFKHNGKQMNPHETKANCEKYKRLDLIYGCGKPFKLVNRNSKYVAIKCEYI